MMRDDYGDNDNDKHVRKKKLSTHIHLSTKCVCTHNDEYKRLKL
jgi:hypothetical protein